MLTGRRAAAGIAAALAVATPATAALLDPAPVRPGTTGQFNTSCGYSHRRADDPIVFFAKVGASHMHDFLGNQSTGAGSTLNSLRAGGTLCRRSQDRSAYWAPTLYRDGDPIAPQGANIYYRTGGRDPASIEPFPAGLKVIAGNAKATRAPDERILSWKCEPLHFSEGSGPGTLSRRKSRLRRALRRHRRAIRRHHAVARNKRALRRKKRILRGLKRRRLGGVPTCADGTGLVATVRFPDCWDGQNLDSADHKSHMAYSAWSRELKRRACPASHRVAVPALALNVRYPTAGGSRVDLASGPPYTMHADFFNAWDEAELARLVKECLNADKHCGSRAPS